MEYLALVSMKCVFWYFLRLFNKVLNAGRYVYLCLWYMFGESNT